MADDVNQTPPTRGGNYYPLVMPVFGVVLGVFLIGFVLSVYVSSEYEKHNEQIRLINTGFGLTTLLSENHRALFAKLGEGGAVVRLDGARSTLISSTLETLVLNAGKAFIAISYGERAQVFFKGFTDDEARALAGAAKAGTLRGAMNTHAGGANYVDTIDFSADPKGTMTIAVSAAAGPFIIDFALDRLWPFLLAAIALSVAIAALTYRFIRTRYDEVAYERARFGDFAQSSSDWFWEMDENLRFSYFSQRFTDVTGVPQSMLLGVTREENGNPGAPEADWQRHLDDLHAHRPFRNFTHPRTKPDGSVVWLSINGSPVFVDGTFQGYRGTGTDITATREIQKQLIEMKEAAERANRAKSEFLANMSHELRTPLNAILGFSQLMSQEVFGPQSNPKYGEYAEDIGASAAHLLDVINDILDISRIEAEELDLDEHESEVSRIIDDSLRLLVQRSRDNGQELVVQVDDDLPHMFADSRLIRQVLINIVSNAVKFTPEGGAIHVSCRVNETGGIVFRTSDTGVGISARDLDKVTEPFNQVRANSQLASEGTGLGLSIVKTLTELHGGELSIESELGKGTTVTVEFPADRTIWPPAAS